MQKKLIALAVAGVASTAAFAQSNVTIYGDLKPSFDSMKNTNDNGRSNGVASNNSNIGFKGEENLGNGLKAIFQIESGVGIGGTRTAAPQSGVLGGRNTFVGLKGGFGEVTIGRRDTATKTATASYDPFADTIGDYNNIIGLARNGGAEFNTRANSSVNYVSPKFLGGFGASASYSLQNDNRTTAQDDNILSGALTYDLGGLNLVGAYEKQNGSAQGGTENARAYRLGAKYNFGATSVFGMYEQIKQVDLSTAGFKRNAYHLGVTHSIGAIDVLATYIHAGDEKGSGATDKGATNWNLGARYNLSKRTNVMAIYTDLNNKGDTTNGGRYFIDSNGQGGSRGADTKGFSVRVQHKF